MTKSDRKKLRKFDHAQQDLFKACGFDNREGVRECMYGVYDALRNTDIIMSKRVEVLEKLALEDGTVLRAMVLGYIQQAYMIDTVINKVGYFPEYGDEITVKRYRP